MKAIELIDHLVHGIEDGEIDSQDEVFFLFGHNLLTSRVADFYADVLKQFDPERSQTEAALVTQLAIKLRRIKDRRLPADL